MTNRHSASTLCSPFPFFLWDTSFIYTYRTLNIALCQSSCWSCFKVTHEKHCLLILCLFLYRIKWVALPTPKPWAPSLGKCESLSHWPNNIYRQVVSAGSLFLHRVMVPAVKLHAQQVQVPERPHLPPYHHWPQLWELFIRMTSLCSAGLCSRCGFDVIGVAFPCR